MLCNSSGPLPSSTDTDQATQKSLEAYFQHDQQKHSFFLNEGGNMINREYFQTSEKTRAHFIHQFGKAKNSLKQSGKFFCFCLFVIFLVLKLRVDQLIQTTYCQWNHHHFFANIYPTSMYHKVSNKVNIEQMYKAGGFN